MDEKTIARIKKLVVYMDTASAYQSGYADAMGDMRRRSRRSNAAVYRSDNYRAGRGYHYRRIYSAVGVVSDIWQ